MTDGCDQAKDEIMKTTTAETSARTTQILTIVMIGSVSVMVAAVLRGDPPKERPIPQLVAQLNDPRWCSREAASDELMEYGVAAYEPLKTAFAGGASYEVRRRIKEVVREIYLSKNGAPSLAFLGIRMDTSSEGRVAPEAQHSVRVQNAVECSAAEEAGIRTDDIIASINGKMLSNENYPRSLAGWIQDQRPGTEGVLGVLRGAKLVLIKSGDPAALDRLTVIKTDVVDHNADGRVLPGATALKIKSQIEISPETKLEVDDLIVGIDPGPEGESFAPKGRQSLDLWIVAQREPARPRPDGGRNLGGGRGSRIASQTACLYVVRGGQWLDLPFRLRRPPERALMDITAPNTSQRIADRLKAEAAFELWWQETFDPTGLVAENKPASDPSWRLTPKGRRG